MFTILYSILGVIPLNNAKQSNEYRQYNCAPDKCPASAAVDGNIRTESVSTNSNWEWWSIGFPQPVILYQIYVYTNLYAFSKGSFNRFKVEAGLTRDDDRWTVCKGEYEMEEPFQPHIVECDTSKIARYIRLSIGGDRPSLYLQEVKVIGTPYIGENFVL